MNATLFWRLLWKEYRMQRAFWIAMAALAIVASLVVLSVLEWNRVQERDWLFRVTLALGAFYALGCGGTLFAAEHEGETFSFQRALPVSALRLFAAKVVFALASTAAMLGAMWLVAAALAGWRLPQPGEELALWGVWGMGAVELLAWGIFFSLLTKRPLMAVVLAVACASIVVESLRGGVRPGWDWSDYIDALPKRAIVVGLLALADLWLGYRWFREPLKAGRLGWRLTFEPGDEAGEPVAFAPWIAGTRWRVFGRLLWHHLRQSAPLLITFIVLVAPTAIVTILKEHGAAGLTQILRDFGRGYETASTSIIIFFGGATYLAPPLMGACVFLADQSRSRFRFLAERGVEPKLVWLSRQLVWFVPTVVGAAALVAPIPAFQEPVALILFGYAILGYACGQFFSMFCRSGILAAALGIGLTIGLCMWAGLMYEIQMSWWWSVAPVALALVVSTWLRAGDWLIERPGLRPVLRACWPLILVVVAILTAVPTVRVYEIPSVDPGFSPDQYARPRTAEEEATLAIYRRALTTLNKSRVVLPPYSVQPGPRPGEIAVAFQGKTTPSAELVAQARAYESALTLALEASRRPACDFFELEPGGVPPTEVHTLASLLVWSTPYLETKGRLDAAFERYVGALRIAGHLRHRTSRVHLGDQIEKDVYSKLPTWAARPGQTSKRVLAALRQLDETIAKLPSRTDAIKTDYLFFQRCVSGDPTALASLGDVRDMEITQLLLRVFFWERFRILRELNRYTAQQLALCERAEREASAGGVVRFIYSEEKTPREPSPGKRPPERVRPAFDPPHFGSIHFGFSRSVMEDGLLRIETERRATRLVMALEAWKLDHGKLPKALDELRGKYLAKIPVDVVWGQPLRYFPKGLPHPPRPEAQASSNPQLQPGQPCIAAPFGWVTDEDGFLVLRMAGVGREFNLHEPPPTDEQVVQRGLVFPIP